MLYTCNLQLIVYSKYEYIFEYNYEIWYDINITNKGGCKTLKETTETIETTESSSLLEQLEIILQYGKVYSSMTENIVGYNNATETLQGQKGKYWKWRLIICAVCLVFLYMSFNGVFVESSEDIGLLIPSIIMAIIAIIAIIVVWKVTEKKIKYYETNININNNMVNQILQERDEFAKEQGDCLDFIPQAYWNVYTIEYFYDAVKSGAATTLDQAIVQYNSYMQRQQTEQMQQTIYEQGIQMQRELRNIRDSVDYHY